MDWGVYKDNEKMIYIDNNKEHPIQVWKVKMKEGQDGVGLMQMFMRDETAHETSIKNALTMLEDGLPYEKVAKYAGLSIEEVKELDAKKPA